MKPNPTSNPTGGLILLGCRRGWAWYRVTPGHIQLVPPREPREPKPPKLAA